MDKDYQRRPKKLLRAYAREYQGKLRALVADIRNLDPSVPPGSTAVRAYAADLLRRGCHKAGEASTQQLLQTLSVVMQRLAAIACPVTFGVRKSDTNFVGFQMELDHLRVLCNDSVQVV